MLVEISTTGVVVRDLAYEMLDDEDFHQLINDSLRRVEDVVGLSLEGAFEYDHICKTLRIDFDDDRTLPGNRRAAAEALAATLTEELNAAVR